MVKLNFIYKNDNSSPRKNANKVETNIERQSEYYNKPSIKDLMNAFKCFLLESGFCVNDVNKIEYIEDQDLLVDYLFNYYKNEIKHYERDHGLFYAHVQINDEYLFGEVRYDETQTTQEEVKNIVIKQVEEKLLNYLLEKYKQNEE